MIKKLPLLYILILIIFSGALFAQTSPSLGVAAKRFVLFTTTGAITNNNVPRSQFTGDVGSNSASAVTGFVNVNGVIRTPADGVTAQAETDLNNAITQINNSVSNFTISGAIGAPSPGQTLTPGTYDIAGASMIDGILNLDGLNNTNAVFIFRINGNLASAFAAKVKPINGTQACNVFWRVNGNINLGPESFMTGNLITINGAMDFTAKDTLQGRAFTVIGAITTNGILAFVPTGCGEPLPTGPAMPVIGGTASCYALFSKVGNVTDADGSFVTGDVGTNSGAVGAYDPLKVNGIIHPSPDASTAAASMDVTTLYNSLNLLDPDVILNAPAQFGNNVVLTPKVYLMASAASLTDTVFLNAQGLPDAVFVIQINGAFTAAAQSYVKLINGAQAKNVFWLARNAAATWGVNSVFNGSMICGGAISTATNDSINGKLFTIAGAITTQGSVITSNTSQCSSVLPVKWLYFNAKKTEKNVLLEWGTTNEVNIKFFTVEKSSDGIVFSILQKINSNTSNGNDQRYSITDTEPFAITYYRLSQTDVDGKINYYKTLQVKIKNINNAEISAFETGDNIKVNAGGFNSSRGMLILYNTEGKRLSSQQIVLTQGVNLFNIKKPLQSGMYIFRLLSDDGTSAITKVIIQ